MYSVIVKFFIDSITNPLTFVVICEGEYNLYDLRSCYKEQVELLSNRLKSEGVKWASMTVNNPIKVSNGIVELK